MTTAAPPRIAAQEITARDLQDRLICGERFQLIDVRSPREYAEGHLPGALNLPMEQAEARLADLHPHDHVVLICQGGRRAAMTCRLLKPHRERTLVLEGGTDAWRKEGLPLVRTAATRLPLMRQVQMIAGALVLTGTLLSLLVHRGWAAVPLFVGSGLLVAGTTGFCGMALLLEKAPWNRAAPEAACTR